MPVAPSRETPTIPLARTSPVIKLATSKRGGGSFRGEIQAVELSFPCRMGAKRRWLRVQRSDGGRTLLLLQQVGQLVGVKLDRGRLLSVVVRDHREHSPVLSVVPGAIALHDISPRIAMLT